MARLTKEVSEGNYEGDKRGEEKRGGDLKKKAQCSICCGGKGNRRELQGSEWR